MNSKTLILCNLLHQFLKIFLNFVSELIRTGGGRLVAFACVDAHGRALAPCGRCRQLLSEHAADGMVLAMPSGMMSIDEVLPDRFCADDVERVVGQQG